jgi:ATP-independent RNA helicase DbpA
MPTFTETALPSALLQALDALAYVDMTDIQAAALPLLLNQQDVLAQAKTGSGKTAAFALAILAQLNSGLHELQSLILCPTRELADQVSKEMRALARCIPNVKILTLCGGVSVRPQLTSLAQHAPHIVVGTPGRILELIEHQALNFSALQSLVLDEADRMLDMGFIEDIKQILKVVPKQRNTWLFSATYNADIRALSQQFQRDPVEVSVASQHEASVIVQQFYQVEVANKMAAVLQLLLTHQPSSGLIFCNTKIDTKNLTDYLLQHGVAALALHGDLEQRDREEALLQLANGSCRVLVATDVAARGLDIKNLPMVIAYELAFDADTHVHRIGRTGRAGEKGLVLCLVASRELSRMDHIAAASGLNAAAIHWIDLPSGEQTNQALTAPMQTLVIDAGRQDKLRPGDILGAFIGEVQLNAAQIGKIDIFATRAYVAIEKNQIEQALRKLRVGKIKGKKFRVRSL